VKSTLAGAVLRFWKVRRFSCFEFRRRVSHSAYLAGAVLGALGFRWRTTGSAAELFLLLRLRLYLTATAATALSWNLAS